MESIITHHRFLIGAVVVTLLCAGCSSKSKVADAEAPGEGVVAEDVVAQNELLDSDTPRRNGSTRRPAGPPRGLTVSLEPGAASTGPAKRKVGPD